MSNHVEMVRLYKCLYAQAVKAFLGFDLDTGLRKYFIIGNMLGLPRNFIIPTLGWERQLGCKKTIIIPFVILYT